MSKLTIEQFWETIKQKYPEYADRDNAELWRAMLKKFPEYKEKVKTDWLIKNIVWWALETAKWIPKLWATLLEKPITGLAAKVTWLPKEQVQQSYKEQVLDPVMWNKDSAAFQITKWVWDIAQTLALPVMWWAALKWTAIWQKAAQVVSNISKVWNIGKGVTAWKIWLWAAWAAAEQWLYSAIAEQRLPTKKEAWIAAWIGAVIPAAPLIWAALKKASWKVSESVTRKFPISRIEKDLALTPTERALVENTWETAGQFVLKKNIWWLPKEQQVNALQRIADDAYNWVTTKLKPITERVELDEAKKMLETMVDEMSSSKIVSRERWPYIAKLKELIEQKDYSPSELLAIRRDFDRIVGKDIFNKMWRVSWEEDKIISWWRAKVASTLDEVWAKYGIDIKDMNNDIRNSITIRDGLLKRLSQENKNNTFWLQDIGVGAILSAGDPVTATAIVIWKKALEKSVPWISQRLFNLSKKKYVPTNLKRGVPITPLDTTDGLSIAPSVVNRGAASWVDETVSKSLPRKK